MARRESCTKAMLSPAFGGTASFPARNLAKLSRRSIPAANRLKLSKLSTITVSALNIAAKAPAAWIARPTSSSPESTRPAMITLGKMMVMKL